MHLLSLNQVITIGVECGIVFLAFLVRGFSGFGAGLVMTPLLVFFLDIRYAVVVSVLLQLIGGGYLTIRALHASDAKTLRMVLLPGCITSLLGVYVLTSLNFKILLLILGSITVIFAIRMFISPFKQYLSQLERWSFSIGALIGAASGLLQGLYGAGGPPIVLFMSNAIPTKTSLRATLLVYFLVLDALLVTSYLLIPTLFATKPLIDFNVIKLAIPLLIPTFAGAVVGYLLQRRISEVGFRRVLALILIVTGFLVLQKGIN